MTIRRLTDRSARRRTFLINLIVLLLEAAAQSRTKDENDLFLWTATTGSAGISLNTVTLLDYMTIFTYPDSAASLAQLKAICAEFGFGVPIFWDHAQMSRLVRDLVGEAERDTEGLDFDRNAALAGIEDPVIIFYGPLSQAEIRKMIHAYKSRGQWPIFCVVTKPVLDMTLAFLIEQLLEDREDEAEIRAAQSSMNQLHKPQKPSNKD